MIIKINGVSFPLELQTISLGLQQLPGPPFSRKCDPNYVSPIASETIFLLPGEVAFIDSHSSVLQLGVLKQTESIQLYLFNSEGESLLLNYESSYVIDWDAIFSLFSEKSLQAKIMGGGVNPNSHHSFFALIDSLCQNTAEVTIDFVQSQCLVNNMVSSKRLADMLGFNQSERTDISPGIQAIKIPNKASISNQFLTNYAIRDGLLVLVEPDDYPNNVDPARFVRHFQNSPVKNGSQQRVESPKMSMLLLYNRKPIALLTDENDISLIARLNLQNNFLEYCKKRCTLGDTELFEFFKTQIAPMKITLIDAPEADKEKAYSNFAAARVGALFFADNLRRLRDEERAKTKPPGPWVEQFRFGSKN